MSFRKGTAVNRIMDAARQTRDLRLDCKPTIEENVKGKEKPIQKLATIGHQKFKPTSA